MLKKILSQKTEQPFFWITIGLLVVVYIYSWVVALLALIVSIGAYLLMRKSSNERNLEMRQLLNSISQSVDQASTYAVQNLPMGIAIIDMQTNVCWSNSVFRDWLGDACEETELSQLMPHLDLSLIHI